MCSFDWKNTCYALACFSSEECMARDKNGHPKYAVDRSEFLRRTPNKLPKIIGENHYKDHVIREMKIPT